jgi:membrane fusion protein, copper/silver efflux system
MRCVHAVLAAALPGLLAAGCGRDAPGAPGTGTERPPALAGSTLDSARGAGPPPVRLTESEERAMGVQYALVRRDTLVRSIRTVANILTPEPGVVEVTPRVDGFVERLHVATTGERVRRGQVLLELYSPMLVAAQEELLTARRLVDAVDPAASDARRNAEATLAAARRRLAYWEVPPDHVARLERTGVVGRTVPLTAPADGVVLEKSVREGQLAMAGQRLYRLADLSTVWVEGEVPERDLRYIRRGMPVHLEIEAYPGEHLMAEVSFVHPVVDERSRATRIRVVIPNRTGRLKPGMFATVFFDVALGHDALTVPVDAVLATGERNLVFVRGPDGGLFPRPVVVGDRAAGRVVILDGLVEGDRVVAAAAFLVDAESRLRVGIGAMPGHQQGMAARGASPADPGHRHD